MRQASTGKLYGLRVHVHWAGIVGIERFAFASPLSSPDIIRRRGRISSTRKCNLQDGYGRGSALSLV
jgi:hypothetical protein